MIAGGRAVDSIGVASCRCIHKSTSFPSTSLYEACGVASNAARVHAHRYHPPTAYAQRFPLHFPLSTSILFTCIECADCLSPSLPLSLFPLSRSLITPRRWNPGNRIRSNGFQRSALPPFSSRSNGQRSVSPSIRHSPDAKLYILCDCLSCAPPRIRHYLLTIPCIWTILALFQSSSNLHPPPHSRFCTTLSRQRPTSR